MDIFDSPVTKKFNQAFDNTSVVWLLGLLVVTWVSGGYLG
jgi:hypothetical protein